MRRAVDNSIWNTIRCLIVLLSCGLGFASVQAEPLFESDSTIEATITAPFKTIFRDRKDDAEYQAATIVYSDAGVEQQLPVRIKTRGRFRRDRKNCAIPPLRLNFASDDVGGSLFDGQDKLKLVLPCRERRDYYSLVELEYVAYRIFNLLSPLSFRARPLKLRLLDPSNRNKEIAVQGFVIESKQSVAKRTGMEIFEIDKIRFDQLERVQAGRLGIFQYLIGNTDWSMISGSDGECCHNVVLFKGSEKIVPIPYDFDFSGLVNAPYATPNAMLKLRNVRQRVYRGLCLRNSMPQHLEHFGAQRAAIGGLLDEVDSGNRKSKSRREFIDEFWLTFNDPKRRKKAFDKRCR